MLIKLVIGKVVAKENWAYILHPKRPKSSLVLRIGYVGHGSNKIGRDSLISLCGLEADLGPDMRSYVVAWVSRFCILEVT